MGDTLARRVTYTRNVDPLFVDAQFHVADSSPAIDTGRTDFAFFPAGDGILGMLGGGPDLGGTSADALYRPPRPAGAVPV